MPKSHNVVDLTSIDDKSNEKDVSNSRLLSQFGPPVGSWECEQCLVNNKPDDDKCVACTAANPGAKVTGVPQLGSTSGLKLGNAGLKLSATTNPFPQLVPATGSWECSVCLVSNKLSDEKCVACKAAKSVAGDNNKLSVAKPFPSLVASSSTDWTCDTCLVSNKQDVVKCVACSAAKPGAPTGSKDVPSGSGFSSSGGFKLGEGVSLGGEYTHYNVRTWFAE